MPDSTNNNTNLAEEVKQLEADLEACQNDILTTVRQMFAERKHCSSSREQHFRDLESGRQRDLLVIAKGTLTCSKKGNF